MHAARLSTTGICSWTWTVSCSWGVVPKSKASRQSCDREQQFGEGENCEVSERFWTSPADSDRCRDLDRCADFPLMKNLCASVAQAPTTIRSFQLELPGRPLTNFGRRTLSQRSSILVSFCTLFDTYAVRIEKHTWYAVIASFIRLCW